MYVNDNDLQSFVGDGDRFEALINALIRAEAWACNIPPDKIDWDYRTNVGDGGRDVLIRIGSSNHQRKYISYVPSVWSMKSGADGLGPAKLRREITDHQKVLDHLKSGGDYIWCAVAPASNDIRDKLRQEAESLASTHGFNPAQIRFFFRDTITSWINMHPGLIPLYFGLQIRWKSLKEWQSLDRNFNAPWVNFNERNKLLSQIQEHLLAISGPNVLHLAGRSGIGKTRAALEACRTEKALEGVLYFTSVENFNSFEDYLQRNEGVRAAVVIDDVEIGDWDRLSNSLAQYEDRIRVVTIGPIASGRSVSREGVLEVPAPTISEDVVRVIQSSEPGFTSDQANDIAKWCGHDLRLALLLAKAYKADPGLRSKPIASVEDVLDRILNLFKNEIGDINIFKDHYEILSICIDIVNSGAQRTELDYLAKYFSRPVTDLDKSIVLAIDCGLGNQHGNFFESAPRALARCVFERRGWPRIKPTASLFIRDMPTKRMQRRFIERSHECNSLVREEVSSALAGWFRGYFPSHEINLLVDREASRVFAAYVEMDPERGLVWLKRAVEKASKEQLLTLEGGPDGSGGWRGRRQIVWLCEHLACFPEHFWDCEAILFRLAMNETEKQISNNSTGVWQGLFLPVLSWTAIPFMERFDHLLGRLVKASVEEQSLIMEAVKGIFQEHIVRTAPPRVVGGRLVPEEWRPKTYNELYELKKEAAQKLIKTVRTLPLELQDIPRNTLIQEIGSLLPLGCLDLLREWLKPNELADGALRNLRRHLDDYINWLKLNSDNNENAWAKKALEQIIPWRCSLEPVDLETRIREVTGRDYWEHYHNISSEEEVNKIYESLALDTLKKPGVLENLLDWFNSKEVKSAFIFGNALGKLDKFELLQGYIIKRISEGSCANFVAGYLNGIFQRCNILPDKIATALDDTSNRHAATVALITIRSDYSESGFLRIINSVPRAGKNSSTLLSRLAFSPWVELLSSTQKAEVIKLLLKLANDGDVYANKIALDLIVGWHHKDKAEIPEPLCDILFNVLESCLNCKHQFDAWDWKQAIVMLPDRFIEKKLDLLARALTDIKNNNYFLEKYALEILCSYAKDFPDAVMSAVGKYALDPVNKYSFFVKVYRGLFEAIGLDAVRRWVEKAGVEGARAIARHILSPEPTEDNPANVPALTEWLLSEFVNDDRVFNEFMGGRHSFEVYEGHARDRYKGIEEKMEPYLKHPMRRIREWAKNEIEEAKRWIEWDDINEAEIERG